MKDFTDHQRLWFYRGLSLLVTAVLVHLGAVWAAPRLIMQVLMHGTVARSLFAPNQAAYMPPTTAASRSVVLPSPDMLYSVCVFDLHQGPLHVQADPKLPSYWSVALYAANSDNFFVINDRQAAGRPVDLWLVGPDASPSGQAVPPGANVVVAPSVEGFLLLRVLTGNYDAEQSVVEPARRSLRCSAAH